MLVEVGAVVARLGEVSSLGDLRRYSDDEVFRCVVAYLWLRFTEPVRQIITRRPSCRHVRSCAGRCQVGGHSWPDCVFGAGGSRNHGRLSCPTT